MFSSTATTNSSASTQFLKLTSRLPTFGQFQSSDNFATSFYAPLPKRKERASLPSDTPSPQGQSPKCQRPSLTIQETLHLIDEESTPEPEKTRLTDEEKLDQLFDLFQTFGWKLGQVLHHIFAHKDFDGNIIGLSQRHGNIVESYLT
ncbi:hypothetical protein C8R44DRAFT_890077 [Mycena epipterygia]|nr:hypothetical protein C8R44DRAFT_890077 [Mycena epipterygia]